MAMLVTMLASAALFGLAPTLQLVRGLPPFLCRIPRHLMCMFFGRVEDHTPLD